MAIARHLTLALLGSAGLATALPKVDTLTAACPTPPGAIISVEGANYQTLCNTAYRGDNIGGFTIQPSYAACVARCSDTPGCVGAVWNSVDNQCEVKRSLTGSSVLQDFHSFVRVTNSLATRADLSCPTGDNDQIQVDGHDYNVDCSTAHTGKIINNSNESNFEACIKTCGPKKECMGVSYRATDALCTQFSSTRTAVPDARVNTFIKLPAIPASLRKRQDGIDCPTADFLQWKGNTYKVECDRAVSGAKLMYSNKMQGFAECMATCNKHSACAKAQWLPAAKECTLWEKGGKLVVNNDAHVFEKQAKHTRDVAFVNSETTPNEARSEDLVTRDSGPTVDCPSEANLLYLGKYWAIECGKAVSNTEIAGSKKTSDYFECMSFCFEKSYEDCNVAQWSPTTNECTIFSSSKGRVDRVDSIVFLRGTVPSLPLDETDWSLSRRDASGCQFIKSPTYTISGATFDVKCDTGIVGAEIGDFDMNIKNEECLDKCARTPECVAAAFSIAGHGGTVCSIYSSVSGEETGSIYDTFYKRQSASLKTRQISDCPAANNSIVATLDDDYVVLCDRNLDGRPIGFFVPQLPSYEGCLSRCNFTPECIAATSIPEDGSCKMFSRLFIPQPVLEQQGMHAFVRVKNESKAMNARQEISACPATTNSVLEVEGEQYTVKCDTKYTGHQIGGLTVQPSYSNCIARCSDTPDCIAAQYSQVDHLCQIFSAIAARVDQPGSLAFIHINNNALVARQDPPLADTLCPGANDTVIFLYGLNLKIVCETFVTPTRQLTFSIGGTIEHCVRECTILKACNAIKYDVGQERCILFRSSDLSDLKSAEGVIGLLAINKPVPDPALAEAQANGQVSGGSSEEKPPLMQNVGLWATEDKEKRGVDRGKRGVTYNDPNRVHALRRVPASKVAWGWNWYSSPYGQNCHNDAFAGVDSMEGLTFIPNIWTSRDECLSKAWEANVNDAIVRYKTDSLMSFNEPDMPAEVGGSNIPVGEAVEGYRRLMHPFRGRVALGAPQTTYSGGWQWITDFMNACTDCHIDFIPVHYYAGSWGDVHSAIATFQENLRWVAENLKRPIWITEMAYYAPEDEELFFLRAMLDFFESNDWVSRYSYRTAEQMVRADGGLSRIGECYACFRSGGEGDTCCV